MVSDKDIYDQVLAALRRIIRAIDLYSRRLVRRYGLTAPQMVLLREIVRLKEVSVGELAERVSISHATATEILGRLEKRGLLQRIRDDSDRRRVMVKATDLSSEILQSAPSLLQERFVGKFGKLQDWEQTLILSSLQRIATMMEDEEIEAAPIVVSGATDATAKDTVEFLAKDSALRDTKEESITSKEGSLEQGSGLYSTQQEK